jgi:hypothetical protein
MQKFKGVTRTNFIWLITCIIGISKNEIFSVSTTYSLHITPFLEISFNFRGTRNGYKKE